MERLTIFIVILVLIGSCSKYSKEEVNDFLLGGSFLFTTKNQDSIQLEFPANCVETYNWNYTIFEQWEISEVIDGIKFYFNGDYFMLSTWKDNEIIFSNKDIKFKLIKIEDEKVNPDSIKGKWIEEIHLPLLSDNIIPPPPCPNFENDTFLIPSIEFIDGIAINIDFCHERKESYKVNSEFGIISFGESCTALNQWEVTELTKDTMIVNIRHLETSTFKYEENKTYIRLPH